MKRFAAAAVCIFFFATYVSAQKISAEVGVSMMSVDAMNRELNTLGSLPLSNSFTSFGLRLNVRHSSNYAVDVVYRLSANSNNAEGSLGLKKLTFGFQTIGLEFSTFRQTLGKITIDPILGMHLLWANLNITDVPIDTTSLQAIFTNSQTSKHIGLSRMLGAMALGARISREFSWFGKTMEMGLHPFFVFEFPGSVTDSKWRSGTQQVNGLDGLNLRHFSVMGSLSVTL